MIKKLLQAFAGKEEEAIIRSGRVERCGFAHAHENSRGHYVLTLEGDEQVYRLVADRFDDAEALALARPGDEVSFSSERWDDALGTGAALLLSFENATFKPPARKKAPGPK